MNAPTLSRKAFTRALLAAGALAMASMAHAAWPDRTVTIVVPYAPGGAADALARVVAARLGARLGATVIVDNRAGASGTIGAAYVAKAPADGYTMLYDATPYSINPHLFPHMPFAANALQPLSLVSLAPNVLVVKGDSPFKDVKDLIAKAKAQPGKVNFASGGSGTVQRLAAELFAQKLNLDMVHVPYKSGGPAITDVMGGQVDFMFGTVAATSAHVDAGKLRALAVSSPKRSPRLPSVPTVAETVIPGYEVYEWNGLFLPAGTPADVSAKLQKAVGEVMREEEVKKRFTDMGAQPVGSTPAQFADYLKKEDAKWGEVVRKGNIKLD
ncbi:tripartite tricarboxylate transporter substrate binding protein [Ramlibacter sp. G-1-2-2]|uniref:Tripartite tricarboxylate transporter substrate binding protein n=1 Tax=Ramlibacter agri TaxID=2728837 RepID=A0A848HG76_9BURK|nr:tripartite tricarboxylate transporter substrate binding protein [Ramlibacter agri]NML47523.1 tripartite tricarboxylate transporter substrate binding protein [Ramlibacter agri]